MMSERTEGPERTDELGRTERLERAKAEARAEAERRRAKAASPALPTEIDGRGGEEPTRYGDWEVKGLASDF